MLLLCILPRVYIVFQPLTVCTTVSVKYFHFSTLGAFRKANVVCGLDLEKSSRQDLMGQVDEDSRLRHR